MKGKTYRLYAAVHEPGIEEKLEKFQFVRFNVTDGFLLIYSDRRPPKTMLWTEIKEKDAALLNPSERQWLFDCNISILAAEARAHSEDVLRDMSLKVAALEQALREEAEKEEAQIE